MNSLLKMAAAAAMMSVLATAGSRAETIRMGTEGAYAPFNYVAENGQIKGFDIDIGNAVCEEMKVTCEWSTNDWSGIIPALNAGKFDVLVASMAITPERMKQVIFTNPYYFNAMRFVASKSAGVKEISPSSLSGMVIGTQTGSVAVDTLKQFFPDNEVKLYPKLGDAFMDLESGRVDLVLESRVAETDWLKNSGDCCAFVGEDFLKDGTLGAGMALRTADTALRDRINTALAAIIANGKYKEIQARYFDFDIMARPKDASSLFAR